MHSQALNSEFKSYTIVDGTAYDSRTSPEVIEILERARKEKIRIKIVYGNPATGERWSDLIANRGRVGRSGGKYQIPILIRNHRSLGGEGILDHCIVEISETYSGLILYPRKK